MKKTNKVFEDKQFSMKTRVAGDPDAPWFEAMYQRMWWGWKIIVDGKIMRGHSNTTKMCSLRKTVSKNYKKWKYRRDCLNKAIKRKKLGLWAYFWWAKFWRKGKILRKLCLELKKYDDLPNYEPNNKERSRSIINAIDQSEKYYRKFDILFADVDPMLGYKIDDFTTFLKIYKKEKKKEIVRDVPYRFIQYFR